MSEEEIIRGCLKQDRECQHLLYDMYNGKMMSVCTRYAKDHQTAKEILLLGFSNVFAGMKKFADSKTSAVASSLEDWIKKEIISAAVQHMHTKKREHFVSSTVSMRDINKPATEEVSDQKIMQSATKEMIVKALQQLTPSYRTIYNLHEVDGYSHPEISKLLDIGEYMSKDSLSKAKFNLRKNLAQLIAK